MKMYHIASFGLPSGVTWIANVLLELGIYTYNLPMGHWVNWETQTPKYDCYQFTMSDGSMPYFKKSKEQFITFDSTVQIGWSHQWPVSEYLGNKTILWNRNYKGGIYSQYKRYKTTKRYKNLTLDTFLKRPYMYLGLTPQDEWAINHLLWMELIPAERWHIASFDNAKLSPIEELKPLLRFLGLKKSDQEIMNAVNESTIEKALKSQQTSKLNTNIIRKGDPTEYQHVFTDSQLRLLGGLAEKTLILLENKKSLGLDQIDLEFVLKKIEIFTNDILPPSAMQKLLAGDYYDLELELKTLSKNNLCANVLLLAFHYKWQLLSSTIFPYKNLTNKNSSAVYKIFLYAFSESLISQPIINQALLLNNIKVKILHKIKERLPIINNINIPYQVFF